MPPTDTRHQFVTDAEGNQVGVILPLKEFELLEETLNRRVHVHSKADKLAQMEEAANDEMFMADLCDTMSAFSTTDAQWTESAK